MKIPIYKREFNRLMSINSKYRRRVVLYLLVAQKMETIPRETYNLDNVIKKILVDSSIASAAVRRDLEKYITYSNNTKGKLLKYVKYRDEYHLDHEYYQVTFLEKGTPTQKPVFYIYDFEQCITLLADYEGMLLLRCPKCRQFVLGASKIRCCPKCNGNPNTYLVKDAIKKARKQSEKDRAEKYSE